MSYATTMSNNNEPPNDTRCVDEGHDSVRDDLYIRKSIGRRIKSARKAKKLTRQFVGDWIGVSDQQIWKYETGIDNISAGTIYHLSQLLQKPVEYFYYNHLDGTQSDRPWDIPADLNDDMILEAFRNIRSLEVRAWICRLIFALAAQAER
ncbi:helix-turn-helix domain-containing protein [Methylobacterium indicum]|uniref:HTH cro/C1-type domain-containing protein n=1 Tax=Methylobacterium indicum TaxID=1775910 RepID=A0A8H8X162_9HYPH|nr:helix-turn-helix transcriptional regulator [Methylobacterium indicum]BCM87913.1 hypothetical protein mvi_63740 [Methylobacterium indicum]